MIQIIRRPLFFGGNAHMLALELLDRGAMVGIDP
jgi:hypothetical protein